MLIMYLQVPIQNATTECFLALLEYIYTDHFPIQEVDSVGLLIVSDEYDQKRLKNLCELHVTKEVDRSVTKNIEKSDIDVIGLLLTSQVLLIHILYIKVWWKFKFKFDCLI